MELWEDNRLIWDVKIAKNLLIHTYGRRNRNGVTAFYSAGIPGEVVGRRLFHLGEEQVWFFGSKLQSGFRYGVWF